MQRRDACGCDCFTVSRGTCGELAAITATFFLAACGGQSTNLTPTAEAAATAGPAGAPDLEPATEAPAPGLRGPSEFHAVVAATLALVLVPTTIDNASKAPAQLTDCRASYASMVLHISFDFVNVSNGTASAVRLAYRAIDKAGSTLHSGIANRLGSFVPNAEIDDTNVAVSLPASPANVICSVRTVRFGDSSEWQRPR
jgi:hypothetical protein